MTELLKHIQTGLKVYALSLCGFDKFNADDLVQEACCKFYENEKYLSLPEKEQIKLINAMMKNVFIDNKRRFTIHEKAVKNVSFIPQAVSDVYDIYKEAIIYVYSQIRNKKIRKNETNVFRTFLLREQGYNYKEIAQILDIKVNTALSQMSYSRKDIKQHFKVAS